MSITKLGIRIASPLPDLLSFDSYLFVGPHPDDIEIGAGATVARLTEMKKKVSFLICTDGRFGNANLKGKSYDEVALIRKREALSSANYLGVRDVFFMDLSDGGFYEMADLERGIAQWIGKLKPDVVFVCDPKSGSESHADHLNVGNAVSKICCFAPYPGIMEKYGAEAADVKAIAYYMTAHPNTYVKTTGLLDRQYRAVVDHHVSQYSEERHDFDAIRLYLKLRSIDFGLRSFHLSAEGFRVLSAMMMHCLPEAGE